MARLILVTGGSRSGKSHYAQTLAEEMGQTRAFVATCPMVDEEMRRRIARHQQARAASGWHTIEAPIDLAGAIRNAHRFDVVLADCLTLWINNLLYEADRNSQTIDEDDVARLCRDVLAACADHPGIVVLVTNEVGLGIVPESPLARHYRDLVGRANQVIAAAAHTVTLMTCGIPMHLKET